jgi:hypothetical protein
VVWFLGLKSTAAVRRSRHHHRGEHCRAARGDDPRPGIQLARSLRKRVQDLIERLEVYAPVYVVLTKADLIAGFGDFFAQAEPQ